MNFFRHQTMCNEIVFFGENGTYCQGPNTDLIVVVVVKINSEWFENSSKNY